MKKQPVYHYVVLLSQEDGAGISVTIRKDPYGKIFNDELALLISSLLLFNILTRKVNLFQCVIGFIS